METYPSLFLLDSSVAFSHFHNCNYDRYLQRQLWFTRNSSLMIRIFKAKRCLNSRYHNWAFCPYAHPGEQIQRRNPYEYQYKRKMCRHSVDVAECPRGDKCKYSHGIYEYWLHPTRYRTRMCNRGLACRRRVCFFAHSSLQLRKVDPYTIYNRIGDGRFHLLRDNLPNYAPVNREAGATSGTSFQRWLDEGSGIDQVEIMNWYLEMLKNLLDQLDYIFH